MTTTVEQLAQHLQAGLPIIRRLDVTALWQQPDPGQTELVIYLGDSRFITQTRLRPCLDTLLSSPSWEYAGDMQQHEFEALCLLLGQLIQQGYWSLD